PALVRRPDQIAGGGGIRPRNRTAAADHGELHGSGPQANCSTPTTRPPPISRWPIPSNDSGLPVVRKRWFGIRGRSWVRPRRVRAAYTSLAHSSALDTRPTLSPRT